MKNTHTSRPRAARPPEAIPQEHGEADCSASPSTDLRPAIRNVLGMLSRFVLEKRIGTLNDPSHTLLAERHGDFCDLIYGGGSGRSVGFMSFLAGQGAGGAS